MDLISKSLQKLTAKEREKIKPVLEKLKSNNTAGFDIKKLKGREDVFRIRKGDLRIIYRLHQGAVFLLAVERRSDNTYN